MVSRRIMRKGLDSSTPHSDPNHEVVPGAWWQGSKSAQGSNNVFVNGVPAMRIGDAYKKHSGYKHIQSVKSDGTPYAEQVPDQHTPPIAKEGSSSVFINGVGVHLVRQKVECPQEEPGQTSSAQGPGSENVFAGE